MYYWHNDEFNIATGLFRSNRSVFAIGAIGGRTNSDTGGDSSGKEAGDGRLEDDHALTAIPHGQGALSQSSDKDFLSGKPLQKRILRKVRMNIALPGQYQHYLIFNKNVVCINSKMMFYF